MNTEIHLYFGLVFTRSGRLRVSKDALVPRLSGREVDFKVITLPLQLSPSLLFTHRMGTEYVLSHYIVIAIITT